METEEEEPDYDGDEEADEEESEESIFEFFHSLIQRFRK
jgi:hypothetical protein